MNESNKMYVIFDENNKIIAYSEQPFMSYDKTVVEIPYEDFDESLLNISVNENAVNQKSDVEKLEEQVQLLQQAIVELVAIIGGETNV